jgi:hypothetical protein
MKRTSEASEKYNDADAGPKKRVNGLYSNATVTAQYSIPIVSIVIRGL